MFCWMQCSLCVAICPSLVDRMRSPSAFYRLWYSMSKDMWEHESRPSTMPSHVCARLFLWRWLCEQEWRVCTSNKVWTRWVFSRKLLWKRSSSLSFLEKSLTLSWKLLVFQSNVQVLAHSCTWAEDPERCLFQNMATLTATILGRTLPFKSNCPILLLSENRTWGFIE